MGVKKMASSLKKLLPTFLIYVNNEVGDGFPGGGRRLSGSAGK